MFIYFSDRLVFLLSLSMVLQDNIRVAAGGCIGSLALIVPEPELESIINDQLIGMKCLQRSTVSTNKQRQQSVVITTITKSEIVSNVTDGHRIYRASL